MKESARQRLDSERAPYYPTPPPLLRSFSLKCNLKLVILHVFCELCDREKKKRSNGTINLITAPVKAHQEHSVCFPSPRFLRLRFAKQFIFTREKYWDM